MTILLRAPMRALLSLVVSGSVLPAQTPTDTELKAAEVKTAIQALSAWPQWSDEQKTAAIGKLQGLGGPQAARAIAAKIHDKSTAVRKQAALALGKLKDKQTVPALAAALAAESDEKTGDLDTFAAICQALGDIGDPSAIEPLLHGLLSGNRRSADYRKRGEARIEALGGIRSKAAIDELMDLFVRATAGGSGRGSAGSNPFTSSISRSLRKLTGQDYSDHKGWKAWWKENQDSFRFK